MIVKAHYIKDQLFEIAKEKAAKLEVGLSENPDINYLRPMELVLSALISCASVDLVSILKKMRQNFSALNITAQGERLENQIPSPFKSIKLTFEFTGDLDAEKVERAINLAVYKYCSVQAMLKASVDISHTIIIHQEG